MKHAQPPLKTRLTWMAKIQTCRRISWAASVMGPRPDSVVVAKRMTHIEMMLRDDSDTPACNSKPAEDC